MRARIKAEKKGSDFFFSWFLLSRELDLMFKRRYGLNIFDLMRFSISVASNVN